MTCEEEIHALAVRAHAAAAQLRLLSTGDKNRLLLALASQLVNDRSRIQEANARDLAQAHASHLAPALVDRLTLTPARFDAMIAGVKHVASLPDPVNEILWTRTRPSGIEIQKVREPFGVVAVVFESRPNVFIDTAALCLKTSNAIILRGGKEAFYSNQALATCVQRALGTFSDAVLFVTSREHEAVRCLVREVGLIDVAIPRGGERLIRAMCEAALIPVLKHYKGVCHLYVEQSAPLEEALAVLDNAKVQRPSACNAVECLLVETACAEAFLPRVRAWAAEKGVVLHETAQDWTREFLALELNVGVVQNLNEAIAHINTYGSHHSDAILTKDETHAQKFLTCVDSACVYHNASTRFTDGGEFGMGAEIGISTDKLHARGPMGLEELTTYKYRITGHNTLRA